jgi:hypothetical protein
MLTEFLVVVDGWTQGWCDVPVERECWVGQGLMEKRRREIKSWINASNIRLQWEKSEAYRWVR